MILYTMMPEELIFPVSDSDYQKQKMVSYNGVSMIVSETPEMEYKIIRLLSSDPQHYLDGSLSPGATIPLVRWQ